MIRKGLETQCMPINLHVNAKIKVSHMAGFRS